MPTELLSPNLPESEEEFAKQAISNLWEIGQLRYKLQPKQREAYDLIKNSPASEIFFLLCHRGFGKTFLGSTIVNEISRASEEGSILIISSTLKKLRTIVKPTFKMILKDCPQRYAPTYNSVDSYYEFPNGIRVHLLAAEGGHIEEARGIHNVLAVLMDEVAFFGDEQDSFPLDMVVTSILTPMFIRTKSTPRIIMMTTPPNVPGHPCKTFYENAKVNKCLAEFDIYNSDIPREKIEEIKKRTLSAPGGQLAWDNEFLLKWVVDSNRLIVPEWKKDYVQEVPRDEYFIYNHKYEFLDTGVRDFTINGMGYYDFRKVRFVVEDEILLKGDQVRTDILADRTKETETRLAYNQWEKNEKGDWVLKGKDKIYRRIGDNNNLIILNDLSGPKHNLTWMATTKGVLNSNVADEDFGMVNELRLWVNSGRLILHPRCVYFIGCLENGIWDKSKKAFARSTAYGHYDGLAALCYLVRHIDAKTNPIPANLGISEQTHSIPPMKVESPNYKALREAMKIKKVKRSTEDWRRVA